MGSVIQLNLGTVIAEISKYGRAVSSRLLRVPPGRADAVTSPGLSFSRPSRARAPSLAPPASYPAAVKTPAAAWRNSTGISESGFPFHSNAPAKVRAGASPHMGSVAGSAPGRRYFPEAEAQRLTLSPRLPHHRRHPMTADEALAGIILGLVCLSAVIYLIARWVA